LDWIGLPGLVCHRRFG
jgi:hypothetical protein